MRNRCRNNEEGWTGSEGEGEGAERKDERLVRKRCRNSEEVRTAKEGEKEEQRGRMKDLCGIGVGTVRKDGLPVRKSSEEG